MKRIFKLTLLFLFTFFGLLGFASCSSNQSDLKKVENNRVLYVGITIYDPMDYFDEDGETIIGFDADLANLFAESLNVKAKFVPISWDSKVLELNGGYIDLIWNGMTASEELGKKIDFSLPYATNYQCVVVKNNQDSYQNSSSLADKKIAVEQGSAGDSSATDLSNQINRVNSQLDALNEVVSGTSDCAVIDYTMAYSLVGKGNYSNLTIIDSSKISFDKEVFAVGLRQGSNLKQKLDAFFKECYANKKLEELALKYGVAINTEAFSD